jgi:hypothetical protein
MTGVLLQPPPKQWICPNCLEQAVTPWDTPNRFHICRALAGITAPMVPAGDRARVVAVPLEDFESASGQDHHRNGYGVPIAAVRTERPDGSNDVIVLAPTAHMRGEALV